MNIYDSIKRLNERLTELETLIKEKVNASTNSVHNKVLPNGGNVKESTSSPRGLPSSKLKKQARRQTVGTGQKDPDQVSGNAANKSRVILRIC